MSYAIEFVRVTNDASASQVVRRFVADFRDLQAAEEFGLAHTRSINRADEADGFRIYVGGVLRRAVSKGPPAYDLISRMRR